MKNETLPFNNRQPKPFVRALKATCLALALAWCGQRTLAQSVGVNTNDPDPSASLEVYGTDKGLLLPRVSLTSLTDKTTIPNPATALLVYNTNAGLGKTGFYYNSGTKGNPVWSMVGGGAITFPSYNSPNYVGAAFYLENQSQSLNAIGIQATTNYGVGLHGSTVFGEGVVGYTFQNGVGVLAQAANATGTALKVSGKVNIAGPGQTPGAGKVLTSDASGNATWQNAGGDAVAFSASGVKSGGSENIPYLTTVKLTFANENYDTSGDYKNSTESPHSTFVCSKNGIYHFDVQVAWNTNLNNDFFSTTTLVRVRGGVATAIASNNQSPAGYNNIAIDCQALVGDQFFVQVFQGEYQGGPHVGHSVQSNAEKTFFNGHLVLKQ